jgi:catechol 2,3-dioxygenase-like lactoylglutathione lyase family enzyme
LANQTGRPIAPARKLVAAVMGTIAVFVVALGLGMSSWGVVLFGLAVLILSIALGMVNVVRRGARAWVSGTAEVRAISPPPTSSAVYGRAEIQAVVVAPGLPTSEVTIREPRVPVVKWPMIGDTLPITVDVDDMRRVRINWDDASPRDKGADPPPPQTPDYGDLPDEVIDDIDDDLLGDVDPPPWTVRDQQWDEPAPPPPGAETVVVRDTPAGPVVEGELVDHIEVPQTLPRRAAAAGAATSGAASGAAGAAASGTATAGTAAGAKTGGGAAGAGAAGAGAARPEGRRPSPRPRGGGTATATADPMTEAPPPPRAPRDDAMPQDEATPMGAMPMGGAAPAGDSAQPVDVALDEPGGSGGGEPRRRPEPTVAAAAAEPSPVSSFPTAPAPVTPPPAAPDPSMARPAAPAPQDDIDLPLDGDPEPEPETATPEAREAMAEGLIAPPADEIPPAGEGRRATKFVSNAAHDAETGAEAEAGVEARAGVEENPWAAPPPLTVEADEHADEVITAYPSARPGPAGAIYGVGITVLVTDLARSIAFYRDTLGFYEIDSGDGSAVLASGDTRLVLRTVSGLPAEAGRLIYLNLEVGDVEAVYGELVAKGVRFVHPPQAVNRGDRLELWSATFRDPDDHNIAITQWRAIR